MISMRCVAYWCVLLFSLVIQTAEASQKSFIKKETAAFLSGVATSFLVNAALGAAMVAWDKRNDNFIGMCFLVSLVGNSNLMSQRVAAYVKGEELDSREVLQQRIIDFDFTALACIWMAVKNTFSTPDGGAHWPYLGASIGKLSAMLLLLNERI